MDVHWTGGLDRTVGQVAIVGCPMDAPWTSTWTSGLDTTVGQAWSVRVACPMGVA